MRRSGGKDIKGMNRRKMSECKYNEERERT